MNKSVFIFLGSIILLLGCTQAQTNQSQDKLSVQEFSAKIKAQQDVQLIDVRTPQEFEKGHLENAVNIDWYGSDFESHIASLDKSKPVFVYCLSGGRSASAATKLRHAGFTQVFEMPGGMLEWRAQKLPETSVNTSTRGMSLEQYKTLLQSGKLVLIDFYADWCAPCRKMEPYLKKISIEMADQVTLVRIDAEENPELCKELKVTALPVLKLYKNNELIWESLGYTEEEQVRKQLIN